MPVAGGRLVIDPPGKTGDAGQPDDSCEFSLIVVFAIVRAFVFFPLFGMATLLGMIGGFAAALLLATWRRIAGLPPADSDTDSLIQRRLVVPLWFLTLPFTLLKIQSQGDIDIPARVGKKRLLNWRPFLIALLALFAGGESEGSGQRIDPYWLSAFAAWWLGGYLVARRLPGRRRLAGADPGRPRQTQRSAIGLRRPAHDTRLRWRGKTFWQ